VALNRKYGVEDYRVSPELRGSTNSIVVPRDLVVYMALDVSGACLRNYINNRLKLNGVKENGTVHTWRYEIGSVRATFQPAIEPEPDYPFARSYAGD